MKLSALSFRKLFAVGFIVCAGLLGFAYFAEFQMNLQPCPLCIFQRVAFFVGGILFLFGALQNPMQWGRKIYGVLAFLVLTAGAGIAGRHVWLTHLPADQVPDCGPALSFMIDVFPFSQVLEKVLTGSGECAKLDWWFLGLSMPAWTLIWFIALGGLSIWAGFYSAARK